MSGKMRWDRPQFQPRGETEEQLLARIERNQNPRSSGFRAQRGGECRRCHGAIRPGQQIITWDPFGKIKGYRHLYEEDCTGQL